MNLLHYIEYGFVKLVANRVKNNSWEKSYSFAHKLGGLVYKLDKKHRDIARNNLTYAFPHKNPDEIEEIVKKNFIHISNLGIEFFNLHKFDKKFIEKNVSLSGLHHFDDALQQGKGIINITAHLGNWELLGAVYTAMGYKLNVIAKKQSNPLVNELVVNMRASKNININYMREANRRSLSILKDNNILGVLADQDARESGIFIDFFGRPASTFRGPAVLHRKTEAPVIMSFLLRESPGKFKLIIEKPLDFIKTDNKNNDIIYNTTLWSNKLEEYIRLYPEQWFWVHRRWKTSNNSGG